MDKWLKEYLDIRFKKHKQNWDTVIVICGEVGVGKSNLALHMIDYWQGKLNGKCVPEDVKHMCIEKEAFIKDLADAKKMEATAYDEAGELNSRRAMSKFNVKLMTAYKVIRADLIFTILVIDDIWDLDTYFRNKRVKAVFQVFQRGRCKVFLKDKTKKLMMLNQSRQVKTYGLVAPSFRFTYPIYKGVMSENYDKIKAEKTREHRQALAEPDKHIITETDLRTARIEVYREMGLKQREIGEKLGIARQTVSHYLNQGAKNK